MDLFTTQIARWRMLQNHNIELIDTTVKSGIPAFAPTWEMVMGHKSGVISDEEYTAMYLDRMRDSYINLPDDWNRLLYSKGFVAIACYCSSAPGTFCHRHLLVDILRKICAARNIPFSYYGEFR